MHMALILMVISMSMHEINSGLADLRLMQLISPALPIGAFTYSQGLEWAVENKTVSDADDVSQWLTGLLQESMTYLEIPLLKRLFYAVASKDIQQVNDWSAYLLACRETRELRQEEINRGRALATLLKDLAIEDVELYAASLSQTQMTGYALACVKWHIDLRQAALGYVWGWLENQVAAAVKLVPLGQTAGQRLQLHLAGLIPEVVSMGLQLDDEEIGSSAPMLAMASSFHETQYTRLFRS